MLLGFSVYHIPCRNDLIWYRIAMRARWGWPLQVVLRQILRSRWGPERVYFKINHSDFIVASNFNLEVWWSEVKYNESYANLLTNAKSLEHFFRARGTPHWNFRTELDSQSWIFQIEFQIHNQWPQKPLHTKCYSQSNSFNSLVHYLKSWKSDSTFVISDPEKPLSRRC